MKLVFVGADHEVTGSCHYLEVAGKHILVDYGMEQGVNVFENVSSAASVCQRLQRTDLYHGCYGGSV